MRKIDVNNALLGISSVRTLPSIILAAGIFFASAPWAAANLIPGPFSAYAQADAGPSGDPSASAPPLNLPLHVTASFTDPNTGDNASSAASVFGGRDPAILVTASSSPGFVEATAQGSLDYFFVIEGPTNIASVPVLMNGSASVSGVMVPSNGDAGGAGGTASVEVCLTTCSDPSNLIFSGDQTLGTFLEHLTLGIEVPFEVILNATAFAATHSTADGPFSASAAVDPSFTVDPTICPTCTIDFSPGLVPSDSSVPEPQSWVLLATGCLLLLLLRKRPAA